MSSPPSDPLHCSFCGKSQREVRRLIAGPSVYVCDECIGLMLEILEEGGDLPPRVRSPGALPFARRDSIVVEVRRAVEAAFPDRSAEILRDLEALMPPGGPLICHDCRDRMERVPNPCPEDWVCPDWQEKTWTDQKFKRADGVAPAWPWLLVLERRSAQPSSAIDYVILAPLLLRRPVQLRAQMPPITDERVY